MQVSACLAIINFSIISCGATIHPNLKPGEIVLENDPNNMVLAGSIALKDDLALPA